MDLRDERKEQNLNYSGGQSLYMDYTVERVPEFEEEDGERAFGVFSGDYLLGIFWNKELAEIFSDGIKDVDIRIVED